jgi:alanine-glyoxylate transaminase/serine-glyoxylate transaminase/serine-pyruvate transaminase
MSQSLIDHRGPGFAILLREVVSGLKRIFRTVDGEIVLFPGSGTGGWESCVVNTLSPGNRVLGCVNGYFSDQFCRVAAAHHIEVDRLDVEYGTGVAPEMIEERLRRDPHHQIKAVLIVHTETSTGVTSNVAAVRQALDAAAHPALLLVDVVSSLGCSDVRFDDWRLDVALAGSQKGLMLPPGMALLAVSRKALQASRAATSARAFWDWQAVLESNANGHFPYTPATALLFGLRESLAMLFEEGLENVVNRHTRLAETCRKAIEAMGLALFAKKPHERCNTLTAVSMPQERDSDEFIDHTLKLVDLPLGKGLGKVKGKLFRIGHLGNLNELELLGVLAGVEMALTSFGVELPLGSGLAAAEGHLLATARRPPAL